MLHTNITKYDPSKTLLTLGAIQETHFMSLRQIRCQQLGGPFIILLLKQSDHTFKSSILIRVQTI